MAGRCEGGQDAPSSGCRWGRLALQFQFLTAGCVVTQETVLLGP